MRRRHVVQAAAFAWTCEFAGLTLAAEPFASRPVNVIVPFPPAGGADTLARILAGPLGATWKQTVVVENRPGASGKIGTGQVTRAAADGNTLVMASTAAIDRHNLKLLAPVALVSAAPYVVVRSEEHTSELQSH